jgi:CDP-glycerol glycerophosphotransferase (TagB/SpsB family)
MFKNGITKTILKGTLFRAMAWINRLIPKNQEIVLLYIANKGIRHSLIPLRKYLLDNAYDSKYKIYCGIEHMKYADNESRVKFVAGIRAIMVFLKAGHVFYTAGQIPIKPSKSQMVFHLRHGNANFKSSGSKAQLGIGDEFFFTYMIAPSDYYVPIMAEEYGCSINNIKVAGDPLCDLLLNAPRDTYDFCKYSKLLVWVPTFRKSEYLGHDDSMMDSIIPLFTEEDFPEINCLLEKYNIHLIVKLHVAQTLKRGVECQLSHLCVYNHQEFCDNNFDLYTLMAQSDGLIGDYSSASMQYLLLDRPMAFVVPDLDDYGRTRGFVFNQPEDYMAGHIVKTKDEFYHFIDDFAKGKDVYREKRHWVCDQIYKYKDAHSCERIVKLNGMTL